MENDFGIGVFLVVTHRKRPIVLPGVMVDSRRQWQATHIQQLTRYCTPCVPAQSFCTYAETFAVSVVVRARLWAQTKDGYRRGGRVALQGRTLLRVEGER